MKKTYIAELATSSPGQSAEISGWLKNRRHHGDVMFLDVADSSGTVQVVVERTRVPDETFTMCRKVQFDSALTVNGTVRQNGRPGGIELSAASVSLVNAATREVSPFPGDDIDIFDPQLADHLLRNRHLYVRNPKVMAILRFRHLVMSYVRRWFEMQGFVEITAPILTGVPLYEDRSVMGLNVGGQQAYLTQCVGFYLEAAVHAFERVYNIGPSFRGEESRSKRHLMEYWHIKAEVAFANFEDIVGIVERLLADLTRYCLEECPAVVQPIGRTIRTDALEPPFSRLTYREAVRLAQKAGHDIQFGQSLSSREEEVLSASFKTPFWVTGIPRTIEPFPYVVDPDDTAVTRTADLILPAGYGELLGVAEKIHTLPELDERMREKGKDGDERYEWLRELRQHGCVPHVGFGMGVERLLRWLLDIPHVRDAIPFPRTFRRKIYP